MNTALVGGLLTVFGTVLGTALTTWTTRQTAARSERRAWLEPRWQEFRAAVTQFASALLAYRLAEADRWTARHHPSTADGTSGREVYRLRAAVLDGLYVLELSSDNDQLGKLAQDTMDMAYRIRGSRHSRRDGPPNPRCT